MEGSRACEAAEGNSHCCVAFWWSSQDARWTVEAERGEGREVVTFTCNFLFQCSGYYDYEQGYTPGSYDRMLDMTGYARLDLRLTAQNEIYVLEANPNPGIARDEDCTLSAIKAGMSYEDFIRRLVALGLSRRSFSVGD